MLSQELAEAKLILKAHIAQLQKMEFGEGWNPIDEILATISFIDEDLKAIQFDWFEWNTYKLLSSDVSNFLERLPQSPTLAKKIFLARLGYLRSMVHQEKQGGTVPPHYTKTT